MVLQLPFHMNFQVWPVLELLPKMSLESDAHSPTATCLLGGSLDFVCERSTDNSANLPKARYAVGMCGWN